MRQPRRVRATLGPLVAERKPTTALPTRVDQPAPFDKHDMAAIKALRDGTADSRQQQRALGWIFFACGYKRNPFVPGSADDTAFACGALHVARQIEGILQTQTAAQSVENG